MGSIATSNAILNGSEKPLNRADEVDDVSGPCHYILFDPECRVDIQ